MAVDPPRCECGEVKAVKFSAGHAAALCAGASSVVHLQEDGVARHDSGLTWHDTLPTLTTFTLCVRLYSLRSRYSDYFFSYAVEDNDNELAFHLKYKEKELRLACCSKRIFQKVPVNLELLSWFSFCAAVNLSDYTATFVHKGSVDRFTLFDSLQESNNPILVVSGGSVILGQDQDEPLGGTDKGQSFNGFIADLFFTQSLLTVQQMKDYLECKIDALLARQHLMDFENIEEKFMLGVETNVTTSLDICSSGNNKLFSVFAEGRTNKQANHFCSTVNGDVATPENTAENLALFNIGAKFADKCTEYDKGNSMWVGVYWEPEESLWKDQKTHKEAVYRNFEVEIQPSSREVLCVIASTLARSHEVTPNGNWDIEACGKVVCTACQFKRPVPMKLRGLCKESFFDREYYIYDTINYRPIFNGNSWSRIIWNVNQSAPHDYSWLLYQMGDPYIQARMVTSSILTYPVGLHEFEIIGDKCPGRLKKLKLTSCGQNMFTCGDGMCINLNLRCNLELDCEDHSDELNCESLIIPPGYKKRLPPPKVNSYTPASVFIDCDIVLVRKLDLLNSQITMDVVIKRTWYDSRLYYKNLHPDNNLNQIDTMDSVWYPDVTMLGSDYSQATYVLHRTAVWGQLTASPLPDDDQLIDEGKLANSL
ncbi:uncharacterized protein LOC121869287 [Homarus americanus]|uniref:uncharacterized protein LOC121869287 n=1 Tax=Homarus americanus TaxID=6706 RepID=UPI001C47EFB5|nr:uncharacterized protein LOC121869287 [Homarus americanus]